MEACPYDQLFIDPNTHTAEKCNFCANRVENQLQPACVIVCPTECRIFGDLDDPTTEVSKIFQREAFMVRKPEKGTGPKVLYLGAEESVIRPEASVRPLYYKEGQVHLRPIGAPMPDPESPGDPRVDYDIPHSKPWGMDMVLYLAFKAISTGAMLIAALVWLLGFSGPLTHGCGADRFRSPSSRSRPSSLSSISNGLSASTTSSRARTCDRGWSGARTSSPATAR